MVKLTFEGGQVAVAKRPDGGKSLVIIDQQSGMVVEVGLTAIGARDIGMALQASVFVSTGPTPLEPPAQ